MRMRNLGVCVHVFLFFVLLLSLPQIEEAAMDDLRHFYQADDCDDELIVVERVAAGPMATPIWRTALR